jgi:hypothetical protein
VSDSAAMCFDACLLYSPLCLESPMRGPWDSARKETARLHVPARGCCKHVCALSRGAIAARVMPMPQHEEKLQRALRHILSQSMNVPALKKSCCSMQLAAFAAAPDCGVGVSLDTLRVLQGEAD